MVAARWLLVVFVAALAALAGCRPSGAKVAMHDAILAHQAGETEKATAAYERALKKSAKVVGASHNLALIALSEDRLTESIALLEAELKAHPRFDGARLTRALVLIRIGEHQRAEESLASLPRLEGLPPETPEALARAQRARILLGLARMGGGAEREAAEAPLLRVIRDAPPQDTKWTPMARRALAVQALLRGDHAAAAAQLEPLEASPDRTLRAGALLRLGQGAAALSALGEASDADESPARRLIRAGAQARTGAAQAAEETLAPLLADSPPAGASPRHLAAAWHLLASLRSAAKDWDGALHALDRAAKADAPHPALWLDKAVTVAHLGRLDEARQIVAAVLRDHPDDARGKSLAELLR